MNEAPGISEWLHGQLAAGSLIAAAGTPVYDSLAQQGTALPYVTFTFVSATDSNGMGGYRHATEALFDVTAIGKREHYSTLRGWANEIDTQLHGAKGTAATLGVTCACTRDSIIRLTETQEGVQWVRLGGSYRVFAAGTA